MKHLTEILEAFLRLQADIVLGAISGVISLFIALSALTNNQLKIYSDLATRSDGYNVCRSATVLVGLVGISNICIVISRFKGFCKINFNKYIFSLVTTLLCNFALGIILTDYRSKLTESLEEIMKPKLQESILSQINLGVDLQNSEVWDFLHIQMKCCGVSSYQDYLMHRVTAAEQPLPMSCCVMKNKLSPEGSLMAENPSQCTLDAAHRVVESVFLHVKGCHEPLTRWFGRYLSKMTAWVFAAICVQALTLLYLSWQGYQKPLPMYRR